MNRTTSEKKNCRVGLVPTMIIYTHEEHSC